MDPKPVEELRQNYIKNPPDMHYFLIEDDDLGDDEFEEGFYIGLF